LNNIDNENFLKILEKKVQNTIMSQLEIQLQTTYRGLSAGLCQKKGNSRKRDRRLIPFQKGLKHERLKI
jgi:hypothetical protein